MHTALFGCIREDRNFVAHDFPTPWLGGGGAATRLLKAIKGKEEQYGRLLGLVVGYIRGLEEQVAEEKGWVNPLPMDPWKEDWIERDAGAEENMAYVVQEYVVSDDWVVGDERVVGEGEEYSKPILSRLFCCLGLACSMVCLSCFRFEAVRSFAWVVVEWMYNVLEEAEDVAQRKVEEGMAASYRDGSEEGETEETDTGEHNYGSDEGYGSQVEDVQVYVGWGPKE